MTTFKTLRLANPAKKDLKLIADYTEHKWGKTQKKRYLGVIQQTFKALALSNIKGKLRDDIGEGLYCYAIKKHLIFYRETKQELIVLRLLHQRMDVDQYFK